MQQDFTQAQTQFLDQATSQLQRGLEVAQENTQALFGLFSQGLQARNTDDVKAFFSESAKVARQNTERAVALMQQSTQEGLAYATELGKDVQNKAQDAIKGKKR